MEVLAVIPARGGSKGIPKKNLAELAGRPLVAWTIEAALVAKTLTRIVVSTDSAEIAAVAAGYGVRVIDRPAHLAEDRSPTEPVIGHALSVLAAEDYLPELIVLLQPTSPLRPGATIDACVEKVRRENLDSLFTAHEDHGLYWTVVEDRPTPLYDYRHRPRRQDMPPTVRENGAVYVTRRSCWEENANRLGGRIGVYVMPPRQSLDIDSPEDLILCAAILSATAKSV